MYAISASKQDLTAAKVSLTWDCFIKLSVIQALKNQGWQPLVDSTRPTKRAFLIAKNETDPEVASLARGPESGALMNDVDALTYPWGPCKL